MRRLLAFSVLLLVAFPISLIASERAGFAPGAIWFSKLPLHSNENVSVFSAVYNGTGGKISGTLQFLDGEVPIGSSPFSLSAGESRLLSVDWTPGNGRHSISARITETMLLGANGETRSISLENAATPMQELTATPAPVTPIPETITHRDTKAAETLVGSAAPALLPVVTPLLEGSDALRDKGIAILARSINALQEPGNKESTVEPPPTAASTQERIAASSTLTASNEASRQIAGVSSFGAYLHAFLLYLQFALYYMLKYSYLYYPVAVLLFFVIIRLLYISLVRRAH